MASGPSDEAPDPLLWTAIGAVAVAGLLGWLALNQQWRDERRVEWQESVVAFEKCLFDFGDWLAKQGLGSSLADACRFPPKLADGPAWNWRERVRDDELAEQERAVLLRARMDYSRNLRVTTHSIWRSSFHEQRGEMVRIVDSWIDAHNESGFDDFIVETLRLHRSMLIFLAYYSIALAENLDARPGSGAPWQRLGVVYPQVFDSPVASPGGS
jgi:hypothetical protein